MSDVMFKGYTYHEISDDKYVGIFSVLSYEISVYSKLKNFNVCNSECVGKKLLVDLALCVGVTKYRFIECYVCEDGSVNYIDNSYVVPNDNIVNIANAFLREVPGAIENSMLCELHRNKILG